MTKKLKFILITFLLALIACVGISTVMAKYITTQPVGGGSFDLNIISNEPIYAVFNQTDGSLNFHKGNYNDASSDYAGQNVTVYHGDIGYANYTPEWNGVATSITTVNVVENISPFNMDGWFTNLTNATAMDLSNLNTAFTSSITDLLSTCAQLDTLKLGNDFGKSDQTFATIGIDKVITGWTKQNSTTDVLSKNIGLGVSETYNAVTYCFGVLVGGYYKNGNIVNGYNTLYIAKDRLVPAKGTNNWRGRGQVGGIYSLSTDSNKNIITIEGCYRPRNPSDNTLCDSVSVGYNKNNFFNVEVLDVIKPTNLSRFLYDMVNIGANGTIINLSKIDTSAVTNMKEMFAKSSKIKTLDLTTFDTSIVTDMSSMFSGCSALETIYASNDFVVPSGTTTTNMFKDCSVLVGGNNTSYATNSVKDGSYARIDGLNDEPGYFTCAHDFVDGVCSKCGYEQTTSGGDSDKLVFTDPLPDPDAEESFTPPEPSEGYGIQAPDNPNVQLSIGYSEYVETLTSDENVGLVYVEITDFYNGLVDVNGNLIDLGDVLGDDIAVYDFWRIKMNPLENPIDEDLCIQMDSPTEYTDASIAIVISVIEKREDGTMVLNHYYIEDAVVEGLDMGSRIEFYLGQEMCEYLQNEICLVGIVSPTV